MEIIVAEQAGFCYGVKRAVQTAEKAAQSGSVSSFGPLIHNQQETDRLEQLGVKSVFNEKPTDSVLIRTHGIGPQIYTELKKQGRKIIDTTCPHVQKAQLAAKEAQEQGYQVIILGDKNHAEVQGIVAWTDNKAVVIASLQELKVLELPKRVALLAQTTEREERFTEIVKYLQTKDLDLKVFPTICTATRIRQEMAVKLAREVDLMIIVGGKHSSNTKKLAEVCRKYVSTYHIEDVQELKPDWFQDRLKVGVTAGASTPDWIIKEVVEQMEEFNEKKLGAGTEEDIVVQKQKETADTENLNKQINEVITKLEQAFESGEIIEAPVVEIVKGGLLVDVGIKGFVPASQVERYFVKDFQEYLQKTLRLRVLELDQEKRKVVLSQRVVLEEEYQKQRTVLLEEIAEGQTRKGVVKRLTNFGAFVDLGGIDGLLHVSELSWGRVNHPADVIKVGDEIEVYIQKVDRDKGKVSLSLKELLADPWQEAVEKYKVNSIVEGKVVRLAPFGAFVELEPGLDGLVHISKVSKQRIDKVSDILQEGQEIKVKIVEIDREKKRVSLSIKDVAEEQEKAEYTTYLNQQFSRDTVTIGELLKGNQGDIIKNKIE